MEVKVYDGEFFERGRLWYIAFASLFLFIIIFFLFTGSFVSAITFFFMIGGYILFSMIGIKKITIRILNEGLQIGERIYPWSKVDAFVLEIYADTNKIKNIVFLIGNLKLIHTFCDEEENIKEFLRNISGIVNMAEDYQQGFLDKVVKYLKL